MILFVGVSIKLLRFGPTLAQLVEHMTVVVTEEIMWSLVRI